MSLYAPSQLTDPAADEARSEKFWDDLQELHDRLPRPSLIIYVGDLNARMVPGGLEDFATTSAKLFFSVTARRTTPILPIILNSSILWCTTTFSLLPLFTPDLPPKSSRTERLPPPRRPLPHNLRPQILRAWTHVLAPLSALHQVSSSSTKSTWTLPWFHRHFPLSCTVTFDRFTKPPEKPAPKITPPRTKDEQLAFQQTFAEPFPKSQANHCMH